MRPNINLMIIEPVHSGNCRRGVPAPVTLRRSFRAPAIHIAGGGDCDIQNPNGTLDFGARRGFGHCFRGVLLSAKGVPMPWRDPRPGREIPNAPGIRVIFELLREKSHGTPLLRSGRSTNRYSD